jgi:hypothetical protein
MIRDGAIPGIPQFFEEIFRFAEACSGEDPAWGFGTARRNKALGRGLVEVVLSLLPKGVGRQLPKVSHFFVSDLRPEESQEPEVAEGEGEPSN